MKQLGSARRRIQVSWRENAARDRNTPGAGRSYLALLRKQIATFDPKAMWCLATEYEDGFTDADGTRLLPKDPRKAVQLYRRGVMLGDTSCMLNLAVHLTSGSGTRRDLQEALRLETRAARNGDSVAAMNAGISHKHNGNYRAALKWFHKAACMGDEGAWLEIAKAKLFGRGTKRDIPEAVRSLQRVSDAAGVAASEAEEAMLLLAYLYIDGWLVQRSYPQGIRWLRRAEKRGSVVAGNLIRCYEGDRWRPPRQEA